eukprot:6211844-Pleurochrysis_carterae.AAC.3
MALLIGIKPWRHLEARAGHACIWASGMRQTLLVREDDPTFSYASKGTSFLTSATVCSSVRGRWVLIVPRTLTTSCTFKRLHCNGEF